jgi:hypothetical protein
MAAPRAWLQRLLSPTALAVAAGLALRLYQYLRNPSMWHDEAALVLNVLDKGFTELLGPLRFAEAAPPLFLWVERALTLALGDGTYALRLIPFLASCAALLLAVPVARRALRPEAVPWVALLWAFSDELLWHATEAKPYSLDVLAATLLALLFCWPRPWSLRPRLLLLALLAPVVIFLVYPGCFLYGGVLVALLPAVWRSRRWPIALAYGVLALAVFGTFTLLLFGPVRAQHSTEIARCWQTWERGFPPRDRPWVVPFWAVVSTLDVIRYCCEPVGNALAGVLVVGAVALWRRRQRAMLALLLAPVGLALLASLALAYPYKGGRVLVYATPAVLLLLAEGIPPTLAWLWARTWPGAVALGVLLLSPVGAVVLHTAIPGGRPDSAGAAAYVLAERRPTDLVTSNAWESCYYFRHLGPAFVEPADAQGKTDVRLWLVLVGAPREAQQQRLGDLGRAGWEILDSKKFTRAVVFLLQHAARTHARGASEEPHSSRNVLTVRGLTSTVLRIVTVRDPGKGGPRKSSLRPRRPPERDTSSGKGRNCLTAGL